MATETPQHRLESDLRAAMKAGDKERLSTLRMLLTELNNEAIKNGEVDDAGFVVLVRRAIKQRDEAAEQFARGDRPELAAKELREKEILSSYLPAQADEATIRAAAEEIATAQGLAPGAGMGVLMKALREQFGTSADGATLARVSKEVLQSR